MKTLLTNKNILGYAEKRCIETPLLVAVISPRQCGFFTSIGSISYGRGAPDRKTGGMATNMFLTPCPPALRRNNTGGSLTIVGVES